MFASRIVLGQSIVKTLSLLLQSTGTEIVLVTIFYNLYKINKLCGRCSITFMFFFHQVAKGMRLVQLVEYCSGWVWLSDLR